MSQPLPDPKLKAFLDYKQSKINSLVQLETNRLTDLKDSRDTAFKYALPTSIIDGAAGSLAAPLLDEIWILAPISGLVVLIYILANNLDLRKSAERTDIISNTEGQLQEMREQEEELLRRL